MHTSGCLVFISAHEAEGLKVYFVNFTIQQFLAKETSRHKVEHVIWSIISSKRYHERGIMTLAEGVQAVPV